MTEELQNIEDINTIPCMKAYIKANVERIETEIEKLDKETREAQVLITKNKKRENDLSVEFGVYTDMLMIIEQVDTWEECVSYLKGGAEQEKESGEVLRDAFGRCSAEDMADMIKKVVKMGPTMEDIDRNIRKKGKKCEEEK